MPKGPHLVPLGAELHFTGSKTKGNARLLERLIVIDLAQGGHTRSRCSSSIAASVALHIFGKRGPPAVRCSLAEKLYKTVILKFHTMQL